MRERTLPHGRFAYGAYFEGALPEHFPDSQVWFLDPEIAARFDAFATRQVTPPRALATIVPRALLFNARRVLPSRGRVAADR